MRKFKRLKGHQARAKLFFEKIARARPRCFEHWRLGMAGAFASDRQLRKDRRALRFVPSCYRASIAP
jgi:hypothetical protein